MRCFGLRLFLAILASLATAHARTISNFDFDYRFHLGETGPAPVTCNTTDFKENISGTQCYGLSQAGAVDLASCACACERNTNCLLYQWCDGQQCGGKSCWIGNDCSQNNSSPWISFRRTSVPPPSPPEPCDDGAPCSPTYDDSTWRTVNVPHDFVVEGTFTPDADRSHGFLPFNTSWYRKHFTVDASAQGQLVSLEFDGVYRSSDFWLNGIYLGHHESGYTSFHFYIHNLTDPTTKKAVLNYGAAENVLAVHVDALSAQEGWFYEGGGIFRHTRMVVANPTSVVHWGVYGPAAITGAISSPQGAEGPQTATAATVFAQTDIANARSTAADYALITRVLDADGQEVGSAKTTGTLNAVTGWARVHQNIQLTNVNLWNVNARYLYTLNTQVSVGGNPTDEVNTTIGIRQTYFDPNYGHILNGFPVKLKGLSMHQDVAGCGVAVPDRANEFRVLTLKNMGATAWRTAHNPVNPEILDYTDKHGLLVMAENRFINRGVQPLTPRPEEDEEAAEAAASKYSDPSASYHVSYTVRAPINPSPSYFVTDSPQAQERAMAAARDQATFAPDVADPELLQDCQDMVLRDRNHPSIVIWSLCNEGGCEQNQWYGGAIGTQFKEVIGWADTFRPVTANTEWGVDSPDTLTTAIDVAAFSYNYGAYDVWHQYHPWKAVYGGESASCWSDRGYYLPDNSTTGHVNANDEGCVRDAWYEAGIRDFVAGNFAWTGWDYKGEPTPMSWPCINSHFGIIDIAGYPKDSYYYYAAWWAQNTSALYISPHDWTSPVPVGTALDVIVYTMAPTVELFVNGQSQGNRTVDIFGYASWSKVTFTPGSISALGYDATGTTVVASDAVHSVGTPVALVAWIEDVGENYKQLQANGQDSAIIGIKVVDSKGDMVPSASNQLSFSVSGPGLIYGTGNGDPSDHTPDKCGQLSPLGAPCTRPAFMGLARVILQAGTQAGTLVFTVTAPGLTPATLSIPVV